MTGATKLDPKHYAFRPARDGSRDLLVAFLNKNTGGGYEGARQIDGIMCNVLIVNSHRMPWYGFRLDDLLNMIPVVQAEVAGFLAEFNPTRLYCFGFSLSGFPAIYTGAAFGADRILTLSPQLIIGGRGSQSERHLRGRPTTFPDPDLADYLTRFTIKDLKIIVGEIDAVDLFYAPRLRHLPNVEVLSIEGVGHQVFAHLRGRNALSSLLFAPNGPDYGQGLGIEWGHILETDVPALWLDSVMKVREKAYAEAEAGLRTVATLMPDNHVAEGKLVEALRHQFKNEEALELCDRIISRFPERASLHKTHRYLRDVKRRTDARDEKIRRKQDKASVSDAEPSRT